jgi:predicted esterase
VKVACKDSRRNYVMRAALKCIKGRSETSRRLVSRNMGNCFRLTDMEGRSEPSKTDGQPTETAGAATRTRLKVLCLHGWRTNGEILSMQMASLQANTTMDCVFIDAPFPGRGDPDQGIALFYPDRPYYEWFYRVKKIDANESSASNLKASDIYENLEESIKFLKNHIESNGPYDGLLGFSQGASMVTRLVRIQEDAMKSELDSSVSLKHLFKFVILIGGVPPQVLTNHTD